MYLEHCYHFSACSRGLTCHFLVEVSASTRKGSSCTFENIICNFLFKSQSAWNESFWETVDEPQFTSFTAWKPIFFGWIMPWQTDFIFSPLLYVLCRMPRETKNCSLALTELFSMARYLTCLFLLEIGFHFSCLLQQQIAVSRGEGQLLLEPHVI